MNNLTKLPLVGQHIIKPGQTNDAENKFTKENFCQQ